MDDIIFIYCLFVLSFFFLAPLFPFSTLHQVGEGDADAEKWRMYRAFKYRRGNKRLHAHHNTHNTIIYVNITYQEEWWCCWYFCWAQVEKCPSSFSPLDGANRKKVVANLNTKPQFWNQPSNRISSYFFIVILELLLISFFSNEKSLSVVPPTKGCSVHLHNRTTKFRVHFIFLFREYIQPSDKWKGNPHRLWCV